MKDDIHAIHDTIHSADSLDTLLATLEALSESHELTIELERELANLPTFGGVEPSDTRGVYSWDATRLLVPCGWGEWRISGREWRIVTRSEEMI